jgi:transcriptional antiterminator RfaH
MMDDSDLKWFPVYTNPRAEKSAFAALEQKNITCFLPLKKTLKQWSDRKKWVEEPLFSSYLFVRIKPDQQAEVLMTKGISRFIYFSGKIAAMPDRQMDELKLWLGTELPYEITGKHLEKGQQVEVMVGALKGVKAELVDFHSEKRLILRIDSIGYAMLVQMPKGYVKGI